MLTVKDISLDYVEGADLQSKITKMIKPLKEGLADFILGIFGLLEGDGTVLRKMPQIQEIDNLINYRALKALVSDN